jgi:Ni,Fe-hydrogenase I cytochrome b subunit
MKTQYATLVLLLLSIFLIYTNFKKDREIEKLKTDLYIQKLETLKYCQRFTNQIQENVFIRLQQRSIVNKTIRDIP